MVALATIRSLVTRVLDGTAHAKCNYVVHCEIPLMEHTENPEPSQRVLVMLS